MADCRSVGSFEIGSHMPTPPCADLVIAGQRYSPVRRAHVFFIWLKTRRQIDDRSRFYGWKTIQPSRTCRVPTSRRFLRLSAHLSGFRNNFILEVDFMRDEAYLRHHSAN